MLIYVAAPYSHPDPSVVEERMAAFTQLMVRLIEQGDYPVSPLMNHLLAEKIPARFPLTWEYWEGYSRELLSRCDRLIVIGIAGWEDSTGVTAEIALAKELNIPIELIQLPCA